MQFEAKLTLDGLMTLVAGIIAFVAVILQIRASTKQVQDQIADQRKSQRTELETRQRAIARAILFEIDDFYRYYLLDRPKLESLDPMNSKFSDLPVFRSTLSDPFYVYRGTAGQLGVLDGSVLEQVIQFYGAAGSLLASFGDYNLNMDRRLQGTPGPLVCEQLARMTLARILAAIPRVVKLTHSTCSSLCDLTGVEFRRPRIGVAGEAVSLEEA